MLMCVCTHTCRNQRLTSGVFLDGPPYTPRQPLSLGLWTHPFGQSSQPACSRTSCLHLPCTGIAGKPWGIYVGDEDLNSNPHTCIASSRQQQNKGNFILTPADRSVCNRNTNYGLEAGRQWTMPLWLFGQMQDEVQTNSVPGAMKGKHNWRTGRGDRTDLNQRDGVYIEDICTGENCISELGKQNSLV